MVIPPGEQGDEGERDSLELGLVGVGGSRDVQFALLNPNPVDVALEAWGLELRATGEVAAATVDLLGMGSGGQADVLSYWSSPPANLTQSTTLKPRHYAVFRVNVVAGLEEGYSTLDVYVKTPFERHIIPLKIHVAKGNIKLEPEIIIFDNCFPGKMSTQALQVHSTFQQSMRVLSLQSLQQPDPRLSFVKLADVSIRPFGTTALGELQFDPRLKCTDHCYLGIDLESTAGAQWLQGFALSAGDKVWEQDANLLSTLYMWFLGSISAPRSWLNSTLRLDTSEVRGHRLEVATRLTWPSLANELPQKHLSFPLTQVGNTTTKVIPILNPADSPIMLQIILGDLYSPGRSVLDILPVMLHPPLREASGDADQSEFSMSGMWQRTPEEMQSIIGISPHKRSLSLVLQPKAVFNLQVHFSPQVVSPVSSLLYIRNNLTVLEVLRVSGQGAMAQFKFGNRKPGSATPLQFDLSEKHLKDCSKNKMRKSPLPLLTVKRSFTARNTGELPIYISNFLINDLPCEGFGFKVLNCKPFLLTANSSRKVEIAFSPDFTLARVQRVLKIITSLGPNELGTVNYSLVATLPVSLLVPCGQAIPRPPWEAVFYYCMVVFMMFLLFCVVAFALIESDRIHKCSMIVAVAAATAALSRSNPKGPSMSNIFHAVTHQQSIPANKTEVAERKRDLNISTTNHSRTQPDIGKEKRSHSPADSQDDSLQETIHKQETRNCTGSTSPQPLSSNTRSSKRKLPKKQVTGNFESCDGHQTNPSNTEDTNSPSPSPPSNPSPKPQSESRNAVVWSGVFVRNTGSKAATKASVEQDESIKFTPTKDQGTSKRSNAHQNKGNRKNRASSEVIPGSEEDTSSTTTEGSTNDDVEKVRFMLGNFDFTLNCVLGLQDHGQAKVGRESLNRDSYEGDGEEEEEEPRTRRNTTKTSKHTKAALEQPVSDVSGNGSQSITSGSSSSSRNTGSSNNVSGRHSSSEHSKSKPSKQQSREKVLPRPPAPSKQRRNQQDRLERSSLRGV
ncbi:hypothetical protein B566_EDAN004073 [Ephemera danica]|nr:hypothetical protein B566_EDAN004073 [Ephemera danica]